MLKYDLNQLANVFGSVSFFALGVEVASSDIYVRDITDDPTQTILRNPV